MKKNFLNMVCFDNHSEINGTLYIHPYLPPETIENVICIKEENSINNQEKTKEQE